MEPVHTHRSPRRGRHERSPCLRLRGDLGHSADGRYIAYSSLSPFTTGVPHIARIDTSTLTESVLTVNFDRTESIDISDNGSFVTVAGRLATDFSTEFVLGWSAPCTSTCTTEIVSVNNAGQKVSGYSTEASVSADGRYVAFTSDAPELGIPCRDPNADVRA